jgi:demethylmenaquinone methyltransferase/2-methoxy-6-polyprenyl-1,4-benzoquinol methylase
MSLGATPAGVSPASEAEVARRIREMFGRVAPRYDLLNRLLSLRIDVHWRRVLARRVREYLARPEARLLDTCCGTGDLLLELEAERGRLCGASRRLGLGSDFCRPMLVSARRKIAASRAGCEVIEADALHMPLPDQSLDLVTVAYGFRNLASYERGLDEMRRVLAPGGCLAILEFSHPRNPLFAPLFGFYMRHILPGLGNTISGSGGAYRYLQESVERFPEADELAEMMRTRGFQRVEYLLLTGGISALHLGYR